MLRAFKIMTTYIVTPNNIVTDIWKECDASPLTDVVRYITLELVKLHSQRTLIHKLIILVCLVCWHVLLGTLIRSARNYNSMERKNYLLRSARNYNSMKSINHMLRSAKK